MMILTLTALSLTLVGLCISIFALIAARRTSGQSQSRRLSELSMQLENHTDSIEQMALQLRNLRSRLNMQVLRDKRRENGRDGGDDTSMQSKPAESDDDKWARETNLAIARGEIRPWRK